VKPGGNRHNPDARRYPVTDEGESNMANYGGEAANYYNQQAPPPPNTYQPPRQQGYYNNNNGPPDGNYAPPSYPPPQSDPKGSPPSYDEVFAVQKPKWNDLWAGLLFLATCAGFVVVSAISIQGYGESRLANLSVPLSKYC